MRIIGGLAKLFVATVVAGLLVAGLLLPYSMGVGLTANRVTDTIQATNATAVDMSQMPERTTLTDDQGDPFAYVYTQNRTYVPLSQISKYLQQAVISIEDRRFKLHPGVDWQGTLRALLKDAAGEQISGGSTITQQLVKNYRFLVEAKTPSEKADAIARTPIRKLREAKLALRYETNHSKNQILEQYLNLIAFGPNTYGAEASAEHFFGVHANRLTLSQAALLAAMINNPNRYNPLVGSQIRDTLERRNIVLDGMARDGYISTKARDEAKSRSIAEDLNAQFLPNGCIHSPKGKTYGYFCRYALDYLQDAGLNYDDIASSGYTVTTTLDPDAMTDAVDAVQQFADPDVAAGDRIANVMAVVEPGKSTRKVTALAANRPYGLDADAGETVQRLTTTFAPMGAGNVFTLFTAATAMRQGLGVQSYVPVPGEYKSQSNPDFTFTNTPGATYPDSMSIADALAESPNTSFVKLQDTVGLSSVVSTAVSLGLRGYTLDSGDVAPQWGGMGESYEDLVPAQDISSFSLGVSPVSPLELANVGATLDSGGIWCPPTPVASITDPNGAPVEWTQQPCEQAVPSGLANTLTNTLSKALQNKDGTGYATAHAADFGPAVAGLPGSRAQHRSAAFLGYTPYYSAAVMTWDYLGRPQSICIDPLRTCTREEATKGPGITGSSVPEQTWFAAMTPLHQDEPKVPFPVADARYLVGESATQLPDTTGTSIIDAKAVLLAHGFEPELVGQVQDSGMPTNTVVRQDPIHSALPGTTVHLWTSAGPGDGSNENLIPTNPDGSGWSGNTDGSSGGDGGSSGGDGGSSGGDGGGG